MKITPEHNDRTKMMLICLGVFLLAFVAIGCIEQNNMDQNTIDNQSENEQNEAIQEEEETKMQISVQANGNTTIFELNDGNAAKDLYEQLPLTIDVEDFSNNEKIFYPPKKLGTTNTPMANAKAGTLAYYAPWGDVVMFYQKFGSAGGLYELGNVVSGGEHIKNMSGTILIEKV
ncbi:cyclophilin-like fold protein [Methanolobus sediminis]|uniref:Cyclophilin-like fold protein n=1 Tax=Methanolobus sediminis TaxID=3072978 RepID=A0AA51UM82_9EURY|nr:cyclophilin-like fold protein [Methanolobus sediminis]WMW25653.1 cyclophilin-like fold protein [Methanolobus sediminis]